MSRIDEVFAGGVLIEATVHNGDGTGTRTTYDEHGNETSVEQVTGLPIDEPVIVDPLAAFAAALADAQTIPEVRDAAAAFIAQQGGKS